MAVGETPVPVESAPATPTSPVPATPTAEEVARLSKKDKQILELKKQGASQRVIAAEVKLSRTAVQNHIEKLVMRGFLNPEAREEEEEGDGSKKASPGMQAQINARAMGAPTAEAARKAGELAVETLDLFTRTGEWAWRTFNEQARDHGYDDIFAWLGDCVSYWQFEREGWQTVLDTLRSAQQEIETLQDKVQLLSEWREVRREILDAVMVANLAGRPLSADQLSVLFLGRAPHAPPVGPPLALTPG